VTLFESQSRQPEEETSHEDLHHRFGAHSAMAQPPKVKAIHRDAANIYQSDAQGNQTFPNPDRDFQGEYFYSRDF
jgi:hypothetical protein